MTDNTQITFDELDEDMQKALRQQQENHQIMMQKIDRITGEKIEDDTHWLLIIKENADIPDGFDEQDEFVWYFQSVEGGELASYFEKYQESFGENDESPVTKSVVIEEKMFDNEEEKWITPFSEEHDTLSEAVDCLQSYNNEVQE